eukprot:CAMPEP_0177454034 /NCGR_PEP_ID=MMETSP0369-20130122/11155_1 /TAXON_ID=447022 ORGANISM="Scrippsiella hangoei-like, Strain SHHI-4" /NCGR_SAMPLE_ID=MMETSP0369 /ASSEMBLY_ACC=CAM_ASM_000364 /LENGTH=101 /DNA_ID=CAMNT_0018926805 /DNA_START=87 /DNA_END=393 /DNA_ORIENTATION=-
MKPLQDTIKDGEIIIGPKTGPAGTSKDGGALVLEAHGSLQRRPSRVHHDLRSTCSRQRVRPEIVRVPGEVDALFRPVDGDDQDASLNGRNQHPERCRAQDR